MNRNFNLRGILRHLAVVGMVGASASNASAAWSILYCDGYNNNNNAAVTGSGCDTPRNVDCWEDPSHNPPQWASGRTYARTQVRVCGATKQMRAYAFDGLKTKTTELNGNGYYALATAHDVNGYSLNSIKDTKADGQYTGWVTVGAAIYVRSTGYVTHT